MVDVISSILLTGNLKLTCRCRAQRNTGQVRTALSRTLRKVIVSSVRDIGRPNVIGFSDGQASQEIGIDRMSRVRFREAGFVIKCLDTHLPHEGAHVTPADPLSRSHQPLSNVRHLREDCNVLQD
jgi:hypothetical protein